MMDILGTARRASIKEVTIIGKHAVGTSTDGSLFQFCGDHWVRLELVSHAARRARRMIRYAGHPNLARSQA